MVVVYQEVHTFTHLVATCRNQGFLAVRKHFVVLHQLPSRLLVALVYRISKVNVESVLGVAHSADHRLVDVQQVRVALH